ncbi:DNA damage-inducible protein D [Bathymodiolus septemdierum thioautotrophic gill symbiont]|uniref:DNA-damage-inducible protein D n=1 Tax=endosymbiont of Bathymodiolus septemdierum str. Myojin knoll TaxID=1303921 RepID=A0A0P0UR20_9GAMM|nr:DNA damage-inducible protein D [Bathymodiolus septemdierum thioautotrophic gill symbiont]BAS67658.1 DNA-damage-inducible protein D [endosymbiont of Bathymodiolus septemdierum str. Myojin knoll]
MKNEIIESFAGSFDTHSQTTDSGIEFWFARDLQHLLEYSKWENFQNVVFKAKTACEVAGHDISDHFPEVRKMVNIGSGTKKEIVDFMLTRYACYLIAQNGDPRKEAIAFSQTYFAMQTRKLELIQEQIHGLERLQARQKLTHSEKELSGLIYKHTQNDRNFGAIRSKGDTALFGGKTTKEMKQKMQMPDNRALADFLPAITIKAKDFATEITVFNTKEHNLITENSITSEHIKNNQGVRDILLKRGIKPEDLPAEEDIKKLERKLKSMDKKISKNPDRLGVDDE